MTRSDRPNPFETLGGKPSEKDLEYDEWGGQFSCSERGCYNIEKIARYYRKSKTLIWKCEDGHKSYLENVDD
jgi:hypothetical protein